MRSLYFFLLISLPFAKIFGQDKPIPILERKITLSLSNEKIATALTRIEQDPYPDTTAAKNRNNCNDHQWVCGG